MARKLQEIAETAKASEQVMDTKIPDTMVTEPTAETEIPAYADGVLKAFCRYEELYVDEQGGMFTKEAQPSFVTHAILFKNPYFKQ